MMTSFVVRHVATALVSLFGYPRTVGDELRGRLLRPDLRPRDRDDPARGSDPDGARAVFDRGRDRP